MKVRVKRMLLVVAAATGFAALFHLALETYLQNFTQKQLTGISDFEASCSDVSINWYNASYAIHDVKLRNGKNPVQPAFFVADRIEYSLCFSNLLRGQLQARMTLTRPLLQFVEAVRVKDSQTDMHHPWANTVNRLAGIEINEVVIRDGEVRYSDKTSQPAVNLSMNKIDLVVRNMAGGSTAGLLSAYAAATANVNGARLEVAVQFDPVSEYPVFTLRTRLTELDLSYVADYFQSRGNFFIEPALFSMQAEAMGEDHHISGFVRPGLETIRLVGSTPGPFSKTFPQISFRGELDHMSPSLWNAVAMTLRNAFLEAVIPLTRKISKPSPDREPHLQRDRHPAKAYGS